jgi:hypothetical protein
LSKTPESMTTSHEAASPSASGLAVRLNVNEAVGCQRSVGNPT